MRFGTTKRIALLGLVAAVALLPACGEKKAGEQTPQGQQGGTNQAPGSPAPAAAKYVCPMHPEVTSTAPGKCSKCGMDLVPAEASAPESDSTKGSERSEGPGARLRTVVG